MLNPYEVFGRCSECLVSLSAAAGQQQREVTELWIGLLEGVSHPETCLEKFREINSEVARTMEASMTDWLQIVGTQQQCLGNQLRAGVELLQSESVPEVQAKMAALSELGHTALRISMQAMARTDARLIQPWAVFGLSSSIEPARTCPAISRASP
jgi:hypothetical protein